MGGHGDGAAVIRMLHDRGGDGAAATGGTPAWSGERA
jgi:hypothetical protein